MIFFHFNTFHDIWEWGIKVIWWLTYIWVQSGSFIAEGRFKEYNPLFQIKLKPISSHFKCKLSFFPRLRDLDFLMCLAVMYIWQVSWLFLKRLFIWLSWSICKWPANHLWFDQLKNPNKQRKTPGWTLLINKRLSVVKISVFIL